MYSEPELTKLAESSNPDDRITAAADPGCPIDVLHLLARDPWENLNGIAGVRVSVAENPNTPVQILRDLANDGDWNVRARVAGNESAPEEVLAAFLTVDIEFIEVRLAAAGNPRMPASLLGSLARGEYEGEWMDGYSEEDIDEIRRAVAANPSTPVEALELLAVALCADVRQAVHSNPKATVQIREIVERIGLEDE